MGFTDALLVGFIKRETVKIETFEFWCHHIFDQEHWIFKILESTHHNIPLNMGGGGGGVDPQILKISLSQNTKVYICTVSRFSSRRFII